MACLKPNRCHTKIGLYNIASNKARHRNNLSIIYFFKSLLNVTETNDLAYVVEELAVLGGPADLHHTGGDDRHLVVPDARVHAERTAHALEGRRVAPCLQGAGGRGWG